MKRFLLFSAVLLNVFGFSVSASDEYRWFHHIHPTSDAVRAVCPDPSGRVWFGTMRGIFRYGDCPDAVHYDMYPEEFQRGINEISLFPGNRLLVQAQPDTMFVYDPRTNSIDCSLESCLEIWGVGLPVDKNLRVKTVSGGGMLFYDDHAVYWKPADRDGAALLADMEDDIYDVSMYEGGCCILTSSSLHLIPIEEGKQEISVIHGIEFHRQGVWAEADGEGNVWVGSESLFRFESGSLDRKCIMDDVPIMDILRNRDGDILVATGASGIMLFGSDGQLKQRIDHKPFDSEALMSNNVLHLKEGPDGALWICYNKPSVSVCLPGGIPPPGRHISPLVRSGLEENVISIAQAPDGTLWFGTDGQGIWCQDPHDGSFSSSAIDISQPSVTSLFFDSRSRAWVGTYLRGLYCKEGDRIRHFMPNTSCYDVIEDSKGDIWTGMHGQGVFHIKGGIDGTPVKIDLGAGKWVFMLAERDGLIYAATSAGLFSIDMETYEVSEITGNRSGTQRLRNKHFKSVKVDSRGLIWLVGNQSGCPLEIFDVSRDEIMYIPQLEGQIVKGIVEDHDRNIWLSAEEHVIQVFVNHIPSRQEFTFHTSEYRFRSQNPVRSFNNSRAALVASDGSVLFGGTAGFLKLSVSGFPPHTPLPDYPQVSISSLKVNDEHIAVGKSYDGEVILEEDIAKLSGINLKYRHNSISLGISVQDYVSPFEASVYYRMPKDDVRWKKVRGNLLELNRLSPGSYGLEVCSGHPDGTLSSDVLSFTVNISSPWYASKLALSLYAVLMFSVIAFIVYYIMERQRHKFSIAQIQHEAERQQQMNDMKLRFFTNISHDFRTPLTLIITPLEARLADGLDEDEERFLRPIYRNAVRLLNLVNQVLDIRKLETVGAGLNLSYGDIVSFLSDICSSFSLFAEETDRLLSFVPDQREIMTSFDKDKLSKIMMNLLSNAFKFAPEKGGRIVLSVRAVDSEVIIEVTDNGPGIPDKHKESIFGRFFQYRMSNMQSGSGIGLHIVKEYVDLHGGSVCVSDNLPSGSVFTVRLPISDKGLECVESQEDAAEPVAETDSGMEGKHLLVVEDNADFRIFLKDQLSDQYVVHTAGNGRTALKILDDEDIDIIISDVMMEEMDGLELCHSVKTNLATSHIPFILLTAKALAEDELKGLETGADDYVTKPFNMQILRMRIHKLLDDHARQQNRFSEKLEINPSEITITSLDEQFLSKAIRITEDNMEDPDFSVDQLSRMLGMHRANLYKKLLSLTGKAPGEFIRLLRLKRAAQYLAKSQMYVSEIAYRVGFKQPKVFSQHFKEEFGMTPREYQKLHEEQSE